MGIGSSQTLLANGYNVAFDNFKNESLIPVKEKLINQFDKLVKKILM